MRDNIRKLSSKDFLIWYYMDKKRYEKLDVLLLNQMDNEYFPLLFQHYITSLFYSEQGKSNSLINIVSYTRKASIDIDKMYLNDFGFSYYNKIGNYIITSDFDSDNYSLLAGNNSIPHFKIAGYISKYGSDFYYRFGGVRELKIFEKDFSQFSSGRKKITYNKNFKSLLNKMQSSTEYEFPHKNDFYEDFNSHWDYYISNDITDLKEFNNKNSIPNYQKIYQDNFSYLSLLSEMNYTKSNQFKSLITTIASILAIVISLLALFG